MSKLLENVMSITEHNSAITGRNVDPGHLVASKWKKQLSAINEGMGGKVNDATLLTTAILLENTQNHLNLVNRARGLNEATQPADVSYFQRYAINLLSAVVPNLIATELVSTQPMLSRVGEVRYLKVLYGSNKGNVKAGDTAFDLYSAGRYDTFNYSSEVVEGEMLEGDGALDKFYLAWTPVLPKTVKLIMGNDDVVDNGAGKLVMVNGGAEVATIDYQTGLLDFTTAPTADLEMEFEYRYDNMTVPVESPEVQLRIATTPIQAKSRKLKTLYSFDAAADILNDYGMTMNSELSAYSAAQIKHEIDNEIINDLYTKATAPGVSWDMNAPTGVALTDHYLSFNYKINEAGNKIFFATQIANASWVIVGEDAANVVEALPTFESAGIMDPKGPHFIGTLNGKRIYKTPQIPANAWVVGYQGDSLFDSGFIYAPYLPIMNTQLLMDENFTGKQGFATSYGKKMTNSNFYSSNTITK